MRRSLDGATRRALSHLRVQDKQRRRSEGIVVHSAEALRGFGSVIEVDDHVSQQEVENEGLTRSSTEHSLARVAVPAGLEESTALFEEQTPDGEVTGRIWVHLEHPQTPSEQ